MFVEFSNIEKPRSLGEDDARRLHAELLSGTPNEVQVQAALKIQRGFEDGADVLLTDDEKRSVVAILNEWSSPSHTTSEAARWVQQNMRRSLGEDVY